MGVASELYDAKGATVTSNFPNPSSKAQKSAVVIGGSISGLFAALLLQRQGWRVDVYESTPGEIEGRGAGIVAQPELRKALSAAGIDDIGAVGVTVESRVLLDRDGRELVLFPCPQTVTSWERVRKLLRAALDSRFYHSGMRLERIEQTADAITACFADGTRNQADLILGADGIRSTVRQQYFPDCQPQYAGYVGWRSLIPEAAFPRDVHQRVFWHMAFGLPPGEQFLGYPVTGPDDDLTPGNLRYNVIWYRPTTEAELGRMLTDINGRRHAHSIPPPLIRPEIRAEMQDAARRLLAPVFQTVASLAPNAFIQPIYDVDSDRIVHGRAALIGDAAFVARPHVGAGVIKAAEDVLALVKALGSEPDVPSALAAYDKERVRIGKIFVERARQMGANYNRQPGTVPAPLSAHDAAYAKAVIEETALLDFLKGTAG